MTRVQLATIPDRVGDLPRVINSLIDQVDQMFIALNGHTEIPECVKHPKIEYAVLDNALRDSAKFMGVENHKGYFFSCDDDLIYPETYICDMIRGMDKYNCIVSMHGRVYPSPVESFKRWVANYRVLGNVIEDVPVNFVGTGCMGFHTDRFKLSLSDFGYHGMADVIVAREALRQKVGMTVLAHRVGYIRYTNPNGTLWRHNIKDTSVQTEILQSIYGKG